MAMFDNPKEELAKLEKQLLKEEEWFEKELNQAKALIGDEPPKKKPASGSNSGRKPSGKQPTPAAQKVRAAASRDAEKEKYEKPRSNRGLIILAILETLGIVGVVAYWLLILL